MLFPPAAGGIIFLLFLTSRDHLSAPGGDSLRRILLRRVLHCFWGPMILFPFHPIVALLGLNVTLWCSALLRIISRDAERWLPFINMGILLLGILFTRFLTATP